MRIFAHLVFISAFLSISVAPARATTIVTTFGPGDSWAGSSLVQIGSFAGFDELSQEAAVSFVPSADYSLDSIRLVVALFRGPNDFIVSIAADDGGAPGAPLESFPNLSFSSLDSILTLDSVLNPELEAGTKYWLVVSAADLLLSTGIWRLNDQGFTGYSFRNVHFPDWTVSSGVTPVFEVNGTRVPGGDVPEPAAILLLSGGVALTVRRRRVARRATRSRIPLL